MVSGCGLPLKMCRVFGIVRMGSPDTTKTDVMDGCIYRAMHHAS